jgi:hypothetical protein
VLHGWVVPDGGEEVLTCCVAMVLSLELGPLDEGVDASLVVVEHIVVSSVLLALSCIPERIC